MTRELDDFLAEVPALSRLDAASLAGISAAFELRSLPDRSVILRQGTTNAALFLLRRGTVAVRVERGGHRETIAELLPPAFFGELSFVTGRLCSADVETVGPAEIAVLSSDRLSGLGPSRDAVMGALLDLVASRLHDTTSGRPMLNRARTVWLRVDDAFSAPLAFATELTAGLDEGSAGESLLVADGLGGDPEPRRRDGFAFAVAAPPASSGRLAEQLEAWRREFRFTVVLSRDRGHGADSAPAVDVVCDLVAGGSPLAPVAVSRWFVAADAARTRLDCLSGSRQLLFDADSAEEAFRSRRDLPPRFRRTARSLARGVAGTQVGLALGGGGACCWAHIGLLSILEQAGIPIDMVAGCSMGSLVGGLLSSGRSLAEITALADFWRTGYRRMIELRFWRMHVINDRRLETALAGYFGDRLLGSLEIPFWANAVDILRGEEVILDRIPVAVAVRASMALPGSSSPLALDARVLVDAAIMAPVPIEPVRAMGADFVIAMNVMPAMQGGTIRRRNPMRFYDVLMRALRMSGHEIGKVRDTDADIILSPALEAYSLADFSRCHEIIRAGLEETERHRAQIVAGYERLVKARA